MRLEWGSLTRGQVRSALEAGAICGLAVGSLEQHGDHLATDTDTFLARAALQEAAKRCSATVVELPSLPYGFSPYHARFGGTVSLSAVTLLSVMADLTQSVRLAGGRALVIVNGHGGNAGLLKCVSQEQSDREFLVSVVSYWEVARDAATNLFSEDLGDIGHAGQAETALSLALRDHGLAGESTSDIPQIRASRGCAAASDRQAAGQHGCDRQSNCGVGAPGEELL